MGSKIVKIIRKRKSRTWYEIENDIKIYFDLTNPHTWDLIQGKDPEKKIKQIFLNNIKEDDTIIDVGANIGQYSLIAAKKVGPTGRVISIEPLKETAEWLKKNFLLNNFNNYVILESAVGSESGSRALYKKSGSGGQGFLDPKVDGKQLHKTMEINVETIDSIVSLRKIEKVDMLKIDVEGFEYEVLLGCTRSFKQNKIKKIICEIHSKRLEYKGINENTIYSLLRENGFSIDLVEKNEKTAHILAHQARN